MKAQFKDILENPLRRRLIYTIIGIAIYLIIVLPIVLTLEPKEVITTQTKEEFDKIRNNDIIIARNRVQAIDPIGKNITIYSRILAFGQLANDVGVLSQDLTCSFYYGTPKLIANKIPEPLSFTVPLVEGDIKYYPFEQFKAYIPMNCNNQQITGFSMLFDDGAPGYSLNQEIKHYSELSDEEKTLFYGKVSDANNVICILKFSQSATNKFFSIFVTIIMWCLAVALIICSYQIVVLRNEPPPPLIALGVTLLFALPKLRDSQPGAPKFNAMSDVAGYYW
ncbi:hypothetical protein K502DRAFT_323942 [Neoconidiobolus thromboides FSU 785]|nr:hypothetical protein K502DRAFT_323942 [Neoconidiobolus thromboides FSU 785]